MIRRSYPKRNRRKSQRLFSAYDPIGRRRMSLESLEQRQLLATVTNTNDSGAGSLREAIENTTDATIDFDPGLSGGEITLASPLVIDRDLTITGLGRDNLTINGDGGDNGIIVNDENSATVLTVQISGITIRNVDGIFGAIFNVENLTVSDSRISGNVADSGGGGITSFAGYYNDSESAYLTVNNSQILGNSSSFFGGGILSTAGYGTTASLSVSNSTISGNTGGVGGGIANFSFQSGSATATISGSSFSGNFAQYGGAVFNLAQADDGATNASLTVTNSQISGNTATGYADLYGTNYGSGGGALNYALGDSAQATMTISDNTTVNGNRAFGHSGPDNGNDSFAQGGGLANLSTQNATASLIVRDSTISGNRVTGSEQGTGASYASGGGISSASYYYGYAYLTIENSTISGNRAEGENATGGGVFNGANTGADSEATITGGVIVSNTVAGAGGALGGGISNGSFSFGEGNESATTSALAVTELNNSLVQFNSVTNSGSQAAGGGIGNYSTIRSYAGVEINNSTIDTNSVTGVSDSEFTAGGGVANLGFGGFSQTTLIGSTVSANSTGGNSAHQGGGLVNSAFEGSTANLNITNSTVSGNSAAFGGAITNGYSGGETQTRIRNSTIAENNTVGQGAGGIFSNAGLEVTSSIVANNETLDIDDQSGASLATVEFSLVESHAGFTLSGSNVTSDPELGPLQNNGGPTNTHALSSTSPAIDIGSNPEALTTDQRGMGFPREVGMGVDIGAFELQACSLVVSNTADSGQGSLRDAITCANDTPGPNTITFAIPGAGPHTIQPLSELPALMDATGGTTIDGFSQPGASENTNPFEFGDLSNSGLDTVLLVFVDGSQAGANANGFIVAEDDNTIQGLAINGFDRDEIDIRGDNNLIRGNFVGTDTTGLAADDDFGVAIRVNQSTNNTIGGTNPGDRNLISGNADEEAIRVDGPNSTMTTIQGNLIGTDVTGGAALSNAFGINITQGATVLIGGTESGAGNVISGNEEEAILLIDGNSPNNVIQGNYIGTDVTGTAAIPNHQGILVGSTGTMIGGTTTGAGNLISGNALAAIAVFGPNGGDNGENTTIQGNLIGSDVTGTVAIPNNTLANVGTVRVLGGSTGNLIGGTDQGAGNLISGNSGIGIHFDFATGNTIQGNLIGTEITGTSALPNEREGILFAGGSTNNTIGGSTQGAGNVISGNFNAGIEFINFGFQPPGVTTSGNTIEGNLIGTDITGTVGLSTGPGIFLTEGDNNLVQGNVISGNGFGGVQVAEDSFSNTFHGNLIGTDISGTVAIGNGNTGGLFVDGDGNIIGGLGTGERNVISGNSRKGVSLNGDQNILQGNFIGTDITGTVALGNQEEGVTVSGSALLTSVTDNVISANSNAGILLEGDSSNTTVARNLIGTDVNGTGDLGNGAEGVRIVGSNGNTIGGNTDADGNVIGFNGTDGIFVSTSLSFGSFIRRNSIGTDPTGTLDLGNDGNGIYLFGSGLNTVGDAPGNNNGDGNLIAFNGGAGVRNEFFGNASFFKSILGNRIYANDELGINLAGGNEDGFGVTANDFQDPDVGANNFQNFPVLTSAVTGTTTIVTGTLNSTPDNSFTIEFFSNAVADPSGHGEGENILGRLDVMTDSNGDAPISFNVGTALPDGLFISATATNLNTGDTSEFAANVVTEPEMGGCSLVVTTTDDVVDGSDMVNSLREAITCANETPGANTITVPTGIYDLDIDGAGEDGNVTGDLDILDDITIVSATGDPNDVVISAGEEFSDRIFHVDGVTANFTGVTIAGGFVGDDVGGGILNDNGTVTLTDSIVQDNVAVLGGGIASIGVVQPDTLNVVNTQILGNRAIGDEGTPARGGGIYAFSETVNVTNGSVISGNFAESFGFGSGDAQGGGIYAQISDLTITDSTISGNLAVGLADGGTSIFDGVAEGGGIMAVSGTTLISNSVIQDNIAEGADKDGELSGSGGVANGGGIYNSGQLTITTSTLSGNRALGGDGGGDGFNGGWGWGGAIYTRGDVSVSDSSMDLNLALGGVGATGVEGDGDGGSGWGGAIYAGNSPGEVIVENSTLSNNSAIGAPGGGETGLGGTGLGGGIYSDAFFTLVFASTLNDNLAQGGNGAENGVGEGGGIWLGNSPSSARTEVINSTVSANRATDIAGGLYVGAAQTQSVQITNSTVVLNEVDFADEASGGGLFHDDTGNVTLDNTIVALNVRDALGDRVSDDVFGSYSGSGNLIGNGDAMSGIVNGEMDNQVGTSESPIDPLIGPLQNNGGPTNTHALLIGSPAINEGINAQAIGTDESPLEFDQRGDGFPRIVSGIVDIGAFEAEACSLVVIHTGDMGVGSLREAIICANVTPGLDTITFEIPGDGPHVISPLSELPAVTDPVIIDGYSQGAATGTTTDDASPNTLTVGNDADLRIVVDGSSAGAAANGLILAEGSDGSTITGLNIRAFGDDGIEVLTNNNTIAGNFIGTDVAGSTGMGNGDDGIDLENAASNTIGGDNPADRNVISGNSDDGINIAFSGSTDNRVVNNYIGVNAAGTMAIPNGDDGVDLDSASFNTITTNVISGNDDDGVEIDGGFDVEGGDATNNQVRLNIIGLNATGNAPIGNGTDGVSIQGASNNVIGGEGNRGNVISGNGFDGVFIVDFGADSNVVINNLIGTDITGTVALGNNDHGVDILFGPEDNLILGNVISGNLGNGIVVEEASFNVIEDNLIGLDINSGPLGNQLAGVRLRVDGEAQETLPTTGNEIVSNTIAHNAEAGVLVTDGARGNPILGNSIFNNGGLGIDLSADDFADGPTLNDSQDPDAGGNNLQNFPVITSVSTNGTTNVQGTFNSLPFAEYRLEFFANDVADPSGFGEGRTFLGFTNVSTDANGDATFTFNAGVALSSDQLITSTATRFVFELEQEPDEFLVTEFEGGGSPVIYLDTSEFSEAVREPIADLSLEKEVDIASPGLGETVTFTLTLTNSGPDNATGVEVTDLLPMGLDFVSASATQGIYDDGSGVWTIGGVAVNETITLEIMAIVESENQIQNIAEVTASDQLDPDSTPNNGTDGAGEDDFDTAGVGQCLFGLDGPLQVGLNRLVYVCPTPGSISAFVQGSEFGTFYFEQYDQAVDIDDPEVMALGVANLDGVAVVHVDIPPELAGEVVIFQAFEMNPNSHLSNTLSTTIAEMPLRVEGGEGPGADRIARADVDDVFAEAKARWAATDLTAGEQARLDAAQFRVLNLPDGLVGSALGNTIFLDLNAAGHGWFVDDTPADDSEFELAVSPQERITMESPAGDRIDLLTVVMHELGHVLGYSHNDDASEATLMSHVLPDSTRRLPTDLPEAEISHPLHRFGFGEDVDGDGEVTLGDALAIIGHLRRFGSGYAGDILRELGDTIGHRLDVTGDNFVSLGDALMIIARMRNSAGEAEAAAKLSDSSSKASKSLPQSDETSAIDADANYADAVDALLASYADES